MHTIKITLPKQRKVQDPFHYYLRRIVKFNVRTSDKLYTRKIKHHRKDIY